jgi:RNA polymerase sigma-70 factor (ECF subfamily)
MAVHDPDTDELIERADRGDAAAQGLLLNRHQERLRRMIRVRLDHRLAARLDPSDVVQEVFQDAWTKLPDFLRHRPLPFYPWLRQIAWERLVKLHQRHLQTQKRGAGREEHLALELSDGSVQELGDRLVDPGTSPSQQVVREELRGRVRAALAQLPANDRDFLVLRYLEQLSIGEIAAVLGITEGAAKTRHVRALKRLQGLLLQGGFREDEP